MKSHLNFHAKYKMVDMKQQMWNGYMWNGKYGMVSVEGDCVILSMNDKCGWEARNMMQWTVVEC